MFAAVPAPALHAQINQVSTAPKQCLSNLSCRGRIGPLYLGHAQTPCCVLAALERQTSPARTYSALLGAGLLQLGGCERLACISPLWEPALSTMWLRALRLLWAFGGL